MTATKRVALIGFMPESNAFAPVSDEEAFRSLCYMAGEEILADMARPNPSLPAEISAFAEEMNRNGIDWDPVPILVTAAEPGGPIDHAFFSRTLDEMRRRLEAAMPLDGVFFAAHGAMVSTGSFDPDGEAFEMVRTVIGGDAPLIATLDLHANISERMVEETDILISYITNPHVDQVARASEAARLMAEMWDGMQPKPVFIRLPLVAPSVSLLTAEGPYADMIDLGQGRITETIANVSVVAGFVFSDTPMNGIAVIVTGRNDDKVARELCEEIAAFGWRIRERFRRELTSLDDAVAKMVEAGGNPSLPPAIFADVADNPGGGGRGNTVYVLKALLEAGAEGVYFGNFIDPALAARAHEAGVGGAFEAAFNSETESEFSQTFAWPVEVLALSDGDCIGSPGSIWDSRAISLGPSALLKVGGVKLIVASLRKQCASPSFFELFGLDVAQARSVVVKSRGHFRAGFAPYFGPEATYEIDVPGLTSPVLSNFDFKNLPRPVAILDDEATWDGPAWSA